MLIFLWMGLIIGCMIFIAKLGSFFLLFPPKVRKWIHKYPLAQGIFDIGLGMAAMHIVTLAGGSLVAMIAMATFGTLSMGYIYATIIWHKAGTAINKRKYKYYNP